MRRAERQVPGQGNRRKRAVDAQIALNVAVELERQAPHAAAQFDQPAGMSEILDPSFDPGERALIPMRTDERIDERACFA